MRLEETRRYKTISLICHLLTLLLIGTNLTLLGFRIYFIKFIMVENILNLGYFTMNFFYTATAIINIIITLFAACGIHSKIRPYMKLYVVIASFNLSFMFAAIFFIYFFYGDSFNSAYSSQTSSSMAVSLLIRSTFSCQPAGKITCDDIIQVTMNRCFFVYLFLTVLSFIISLINVLLVRMALKSKIEESIPKPPGVKVSDVGCTSSSLRTRRPIDVGINLEEGRLSTMKDEGEKV